MKRLLLCCLLLTGVACAETFDAAAAVVNGEEIERGELELQVDARLAGDPGATDPAARQQVAREVLSDLIRQRLLAQQARARGLDVTSEEIQAQIDEIRSRYPDEAAFQQAVTEAGLTVDELSERVELQVLADKLARAIAPDPSDEQIRAVYEERRASFRELQVKHILYAIRNNNVAGARRKADNALGVLRARTRTFADLATTSDDPSSADFGGVLADQNGTRPGWFADGTLDPTFFEAAYGARPGEIVGPVRTSFGFHLIVTIRKRVAPLERVRDQLVEQMRAETADTVVQDAIGQAAVAARVLINPRYGEWDPQTLTIVPHESYVPAEPEPSPSLPEPVLEVGG